MTFAHRITGLLLAALIVLTAQSAALARTMPDASGQMVICTGTGPVMIYVDAEGAPTAAPHICPEFALSLILALDAPALSFAPQGTWDKAPSGILAAAQATVQLGTAQARGPPVSM